MFDWTKKFFAFALCSIICGAELVAAQQPGAGRFAVGAAIYTWDGVAWMGGNNYLDAGSLKTYLDGAPQQILTNIRDLITAQHYRPAPGVQPPAGAPGVQNIQPLPAGPPAANPIFPTHPEWAGLSDHIFSHGHAGRYVGVWGARPQNARGRVDRADVRGMFNLMRTLVDAAPNAPPNDGVHLPLYQPAAGGGLVGQSGPVQPPV